MLRACRRLAYVWLLSSCADSVPASPAPSAKLTAHAPTVAASEAVPPPLAHDCEDLLLQVSRDPRDAALLTALCPSTPLTEVTARALLASAGSSWQARNLLTVLQPYPELHALAALVGHKQLELPPGATLASPRSATVTPLTLQIVATAQLARAQIVAKETLPDQRTRARAYLAKVYVHALKQSGVGPQRPGGAFARLLAAQAITHGRQFCTAYWRRRVRGLHGVFAEVEAGILQATLTLEATPHLADSALAVVELGRGRRYTQRSGPATRLRARNRGGASLSLDRLGPATQEIERLLAHGFVDLALERVEAEARSPAGVGLGELQLLVEHVLRQYEAQELLPRARARMARIRSRRSPPPETSKTTLAALGPRSWTSSENIADDALALLQRMPATGFARRWVLGHTIILMRERPDALRGLIDRVLGTDTGSRAREAVPVLRGLVQERASSRLVWLRHRVALDRAQEPTTQSDQRRRLALTAQQARLASF